MSTCGGVGLVLFVETHGALLGDRQWRRAMKVHELIMRRLAERSPGFRAAEIVGISPRQNRWEKHGYEGCWVDAVVSLQRNGLQFQCRKRCCGLYREEFCWLRINGA